MPNSQQTLFPSLNDVMDLSRSIVNDMYPGTNGQNGRILSNDAPFTIRYINSALRIMLRALRNEGVRFPILDNVIVQNIPPVASPNTALQVYLSVNGFFDGQTMHVTPSLPSDLMQPYNVWEQQFGTTNSFIPMAQPQGGLPSILQGPRLSFWEWRDNYKLFFVGSTVAQNIRLRYVQGQLPFNTPPADFSTTNVSIQDCDEAMAYGIAIAYSQARGAAPDVIANLTKARDEAIDEMALAWVRQSQGINFRREAYEDSGSSNRGQIGGTGQVQVGG